MKNLRSIFVFDDIPPEDNAMLQALYSRDPRSVTVHLDRVKSVGAGKFMANYYVGYGHKSIGDCGTTTLFIEQVSLLAAKAIQNTPLYNGQEASTRYLDYAQQKVLDPIKSEKTANLQKTTMEFYSKIITDLIPFLKERFPIQADQKEVTYMRAIEAKAFDIARGFLPAGCTTLLSWHTNLRQAQDHLKELEYHPLAEINEIAGEVRDRLKEKYPNSFNFKTYQTQEDYLALGGETYYYHNKNCADFKFSHNLNFDLIAKHSNLICNRPIKTELPRYLRKIGTFNFEFKLDFGSFRDIHRQRSMICQMPLLTTDLGFNSWYLNQLPEKLRLEAESFLAKLKDELTSLKQDPAILQYYIPIGYDVACDCICDLASAIYISELRAETTVHATLRRIAQLMGETILETIPGIAMHHNLTDSDWDIKRGNQTISEKTL